MGALLIAAAALLLVAAHAQDPASVPFQGRRLGGLRRLGRRGGVQPFQGQGAGEEPTGGSRGSIRRSARAGLAGGGWGGRRGTGRIRRRTPGTTARLSLVAASRRSGSGEAPAASSPTDGGLAWSDEPLELFQQVTAALNHSLGFTRPRPDLPPRTKLGFLKTHKTGSTSVAGAIFRFGARHGLRHYQREGHLMEFRDKSLFGEPGSWDLVYNHYSGIGYWQSPELGNHDFFELEAWYRTMLGPESEVTTIVRRPVSHYLSHFYYFLEPQRVNFTLAKYLREGHNNPLSNEFGVNHHNPQRVDAFFSRGLGLLDTVMLMERMGESLVVLRHRMNWDLRDLTSLVMYKSSNGAMRYDGKPIQPTPKVRDLQPETLKRIQALTGLDQRIYEASEEKLNRQVEELRAQGVDVEAEVGALASLNGALEKACGMVRGEIQGWWHRFEGEHGLTETSRIRGRDIEEWLDFKRQKIYPTVQGAEAWESMGMLCWWYSLADTCYEKLPGRKTGVAEAVWGIPPYRENSPGHRHAGEKSVFDMKKWNWFELADFEHCECRGKGTRGPPCLG